jgi:hypothetical protein
MPIVPVELFRCGNGTSPKLTRVPPGLDITTIVDANGVTTVLPNTGGVSSFDSKSVMQGQWWKIGKGEWYDFRLVLCQGAHGHWTWGPLHQMPLDQYVLGLQATEAGFTKA